MAHDSLFSFDDPAGGAVDGTSATDPERYFHPGEHAPLAVRMRPRSLDEVVGQQDAIGPGTPLRRLIAGHGAASVILYGPPGTGKTTIASLISTAAGRHFAALSALNSGVKEVRAVIADARQRLKRGETTVLFIDEVHRFSKTQQDALLAAVENRTVLLVAATTENPSFSVVAPLLSRSLLVQLTSLADADIAELLTRAMRDERGFGGRLTLAEDARRHIVDLAGGDARRALTYLDAAAEAAGEGAGTLPASARDEVPEITLAAVQSSIPQAVVRYDRDGDQHYDVTSAFIKSIRGSDPDAALHYLARMIQGGEDPRFIARRLVIHASEDIGMADPQALLIATAASTAVATIGLPEARLTLAHATIYLATAPKSNGVIAAMNAALEDVKKGKGAAVPPHLRDGHYEGAAALGNAVGYRYPHDDQRGVVEQQYLPDDLRETHYYEPTEHGFERTISSRLRSLRAIQRGGKQRE